MQEGVTLCRWEPDKSESCSARPPPSSANFVILIALLTAVMSIPFIVIIEFVLEGSASNVPGSRGFEDDINFEKEEKIKEAEAFQKLNSSNELLKTSRQSAFGEMIKKGVLSGGASKKVSSSEVAQMAYAGEFEWMTHLWVD